MLTQSISDIDYKIYVIRGKRVMIDSDLAALYRVETKSLNRAVKRNIDNFPEDFMFQLTEGESISLSLRYQIGTSKSIKGGRRYLPYAFTEQGVSMLSSVLRSKQAIQVNIQIMRTFTKIREMLATNKDLREKIEKLEEKYDQQFTVVFTAIKRLINPPEDPKSGIGFRTNNL